MKKKKIIAVIVSLIFVSAWLALTIPILIAIDAGFMVALVNGLVTGFLANLIYAWSVKL